MRRTAATVEFDTPDRGRVQFTVNGHRIAVPEPVAASLAGLAVGERMSAASVFPGVPADGPPVPRKGWPGSACWR